MTIDSRALALALMAAAGGAPAAAQTANMSDAVPTPSATPVPVPPAPTITLPSASPSAAPTPKAGAKAEKPAPRRTAPAPQSTSPRETVVEPRETPKTEPVLPEPVASPSPVPVVTPTPVPTPAPVAPPAPAPVAAVEEGGTIWRWLLGGAVIVVMGIVAWIASRRRQPVGIKESEPVAGPVLATIPVASDPTAPMMFTPPPPRVSAPPRARLTLAFRPVRGGLNMLSATVEGEVVVTNSGDARAEAVRLQAILLSAHAGQDADLAAAQALPIGRPVTPPFALAPGEQRIVRTVTALPRDGIRTMTAAGRPMFVPIVAINALYIAAEGISGQTAHAFAVGVERVESPKLAPLWLDGPPRMHDTLAARAHGAAIER